MDYRAIGVEMNKYKEALVKLAHHYHNQNFLPTQTAVRKAISVLDSDEWEPKFDEWILVSKERKSPLMKRKFVYKDGDNFICRTINATIYYGWKFAKPILGGK